MKQKPAGFESTPGPGGILVWKRPHIIRPDAAITHVAVAKCVEFMVRNFSEPIQMKHLVKASGMSRRGFCKAFNKTVGLNPGAALQGMRIEHAKRILAEHDFVLKQIARQCGYRSENTFCVAFQRAVGMPPKKFQRQYWLEMCRHQGPGKAQSVIANQTFPSTLEGNFPGRSKKSNINLKALVTRKQIL